MAAPGPDFSFTHVIGKASTLVVDCYGANTPDEVYVVTFQSESLAFSGVDFDNYIGSLAEMRDQVRAAAPKGK